MTMHFMTNRHGVPFGGQERIAKHETCLVDLETGRAEFSEGGEHGIEGLKHPSASQIGFPRSR